MDKYLVVFVGMIIFAFTACTPKQKTILKVPDDAPVINVATLTCVTTGCNMNSLNIYTYEGIGFKKIKTVEAQKTDTFEITVPLEGHQFYYIGPAENNIKPIVLGGETEVTMKANCQRFRSSEVSNSKINDAYNWGIMEARNNQSQRNSLAREFQQSLVKRDQKNLETIVGKLAKNDQAQLNLLDTLYKIDPFVGKLAATKTYISYQNNKGNYDNELDYFVVETFRHNDLKDPQLDKLTAVYEQFNDFAKVLTSINLPNDLLKANIDKVLAQIPTDRKTYKYAMGGILHALQSNNHPAFIDYAKLFTDKYKGTDTPGIDGLQGQIGNAQSFITGAEAPDFTQNTPEGAPISLSDFRGKVVLIDFWASWCGPCRKENPNVVKMYNEYKDQGFEILGVSLDKSKDPWLKAIAKDGLPWHHVSDLKGWSNEVAAMYSVRSIPHTVLVDEEGKIIARNLRGPQLEQMLAKVLEGK